MYARSFICPVKALEAVVSYAGARHGERLCAWIRRATLALVAAAASRMTEATVSHGTASTTLRGLWHVKRAIPASINPSRSMHLAASNSCHQEQGGPGF